MNNAELQIGEVQWPREKCSLLWINWSGFKPPGWGGGGYAVNMQSECYNLLGK